MSLVYTNTLAQYPTPFTCFNASEYTLWSSDPVLLPTDSAGSLTSARLRTGVIALKLRRCRVMPAAALVEVRPILSDTRLTELDPSSPVTLQVSAMVNIFIAENSTEQHKLSVCIENTLHPAATVKILLWGSAWLIFESY